jgi:antitoxin component of RelBE/YafQ-DinJ toxin-antitoxin module
MDENSTQSFLDLEAQAESILQSMGMDLEETYRAFLHKIVNNEITQAEIQRIGMPSKEANSVSNGHDMHENMQTKTWEAKVEAFKSISDKIASTAAKDGLDIDLDNERAKRINKAL